MVKQWVIDSLDSHMGCTWNLFKVARQWCVSTVAGNMGPLDFAIVPVANASSTPFDTAWLPMLQVTVLSETIKTL